MVGIMKVLMPQIQATLNNIASLFGLVPNRVPGSTTVPGEFICQLAARHHGLPNGEFLFRPGKCLKLSKAKNKYPPLVVYEETRDGNLNDIWLGHLRFTGYFSITASTKHLLNTQFSEQLASSESTEREGVDDAHTLFLFPYERKDGEAISNLLIAKGNFLTSLDIQSISFCAASTGSSRLLHALSEVVKHSISHNKNLSALLMLDILNCSSVVRYKIDCEKDIFEQISNSINKKCDDEKPTANCYWDARVLDKIATLFSLRRSYNEVTSGLVKTFSDFVCDRLECLSPKLVTNIVSAVGNSKCLDEFWMFMMAKRIQDTAQCYEPEDLATIIDTYATASLEVKFLTD